MRILAAAPSWAFFHLRHASCFRSGLLEVGRISIHRNKSLSLFGSLDYEYVPPNNEAAAAAPPSSFAGNLPSGYPAGTPPGLRGEAVRSALRSGRCVGWSDLRGTPLQRGGIVQVAGVGTTAFLNNKFTQSFSSAEEAPRFQEACLLTSKGRVVDRIGVGLPEEDGGTAAYLLTSPGHRGRDLFERLNRHVFPMDQVTLFDRTDDAFLFSLASVRREHLQSAFDDFIAPMLDLDGGGGKKWRLPRVGECVSMPIPTVLGDEGGTLLVVPTAGLPPCAGAGCTFCFLNCPEGLGQGIWSHLVSDDNPLGPVEIGASEYEALRIEAGQPGFGAEMTAADDATAGNSDAAAPPASPLELHMQDAIDMDKGCYLGQEGVASMHKNPRGPPRTLYRVVFDDEHNVFDYQSAGDGSSIPNRTRTPVPGDRLFVLGSNGEIAAGVLTSVAEPGSTGDPVTIGLALVRRADSIRKQMRGMDLEIPNPVGSSGAMMDFVVAKDGSGMIAAPPPLDPLEGLEVIIGGTYTVGTLETLPSRRFRSGTCMFDDNVPEFVKNLPGEDPNRDIINFSRLEESMPLEAVDVDDTSKAQGGAPPNEEELVAAAKVAEEEARAADEAEAERKAEKMEMLRKRAEEAMATRKKKKKKKKKKLGQ